MMPKIFIINNKIIEKCKTFSEEIINTTDYSDSNQYDKEKEKHDHFIGKIGEFGAFLYLKSNGYNVNEPDLNVYSKDKKSWQEDILSDKENFNVKTQDLYIAKSLSKKLNLKLNNVISWTFQYGNIRKDTIFNTNGNVLFTLHIKKSKIDNHKVLVFPLKKVNEIVFDVPLLEHVKSTKRIAYGQQNYKEFNSWLTKFGVD